LNVERPLVYIASPLFNEAERAFNQRVDEFVAGLDFRTFLPQREPGEAMMLIDLGEPAEVVRPCLFQLDWKTIQECDLFLILLDGRVPDEGACVELGMAFALGKRCVGFQTDSRRFSRQFNNVMIDGCLTGLAQTWEELRGLLR
jgi:nucleoside 2-deoxyribosyltransferase